jgi:hypothetical protein
MDYWLSTRTPARAFRPSYQTVELDAFIRETAGVDPSILAQEIGLASPFVRAYQRQLGVRKIGGNPPRKSRI